MRLVKLSQSAGSLFNIGRTRWNLNFTNPNIFLFATIDLRPLAGYTQVRAHKILGPRARPKLPDSAGGFASVRIDAILYARRI